MPFEELQSPIPEISTESKRQIPEFVLEERRAAWTLLEPEIKRPVRPTYALICNFTPNLAPRVTTPGMEMWSEFRYAATGETNYPRWAETIVVDEAEHKVGLYAVEGEMPDGTKYSYRSLRCSCCLPDFRSLDDPTREYRECPAQNVVIENRARVYRQALGKEHLSGVSSTGRLYLLTKFIMEKSLRDQFAWPPSHRSDQLLLRGLAIIQDVPEEEVRLGAEELAEDNVVQLHGLKNMSITLAA